jgi:hypothetical protein
MLEKENEFLEAYRKVVSFNVPDNFLRKMLCSSNKFTTIFPMGVIALLNKGVPLLSASIELLKSEKPIVSAEGLTFLISIAIYDNKNSQKLTQEDYFTLATVSANTSLSGAPRVHKSSLEQLKVIKFIADEKYKKEASLLVYKNILKYENTAFLQKKIAKHWGKINGDIQEIIHLVPALSKESKEITIDSMEVKLFKIDFNKIGVVLEKVSEQKYIMGHFVEILNAFKSVESDHGYLFDTKNSDLNKSTVYFSSLGKVDNFKALVEFCFKDIAKIVKNPTIETYELAKEAYPKLTMYNELSESIDKQKDKVRKSIKI